LKELVRRVGQRFMVGWEGHEPSSHLKHLIRDFGVGHVILFARNVDAPGQVAELIRELQSQGSWAEGGRTCSGRSGGRRADDPRPPGTPRAGDA